MYRLFLKRWWVSLAAAALLTAVSLLLVRQWTPSLPCAAEACAHADRAGADERLATLEEGLRNAWLAASTGALGGDAADRAAGSAAASPARGGAWPPAYYWDIASQLGTAVPVVEGQDRLASFDGAFHPGFLLPAAAGLASDVVDVARRDFPVVPASRNTMMLVGALAIIGFMVRRRSGMDWAGTLR